MFDLAAVECKKKIILIVDDDDLILILLKKVLEPKYEVLTATDAILAMSAVSITHIDLIISDINMPRLSGYAFLKLIKEIKENIPFVLMSSFKNKDEEDEAIEHGAVAVLIKPFHKNEIVAFVSRIFSSQMPDKSNQIAEASVPVRPNEVSGYDLTFSKILAGGLLLGKIAKWDIYINVDSKIVKYLNVGDTIDIQRIEDLKEQGLQYFYMKNESFDEYKSVNLKILKKIRSIGVPQTPQGRQVFQNFQNVILEQFRFHNISRSLFEDSKLIVLNAIYELELNPDISELLNRINFHTEWLYVHNLGVALFSIMIAKQIGICREDQLSILAQASILHDVGLMELDPNVLNKPRHKQTINERHLFESHPERGVKILEPFHLNRNILTIIAQHHEDCLGTGFSVGLKQAKIHPFSRILAVADEFIFIGNKSPRCTVDLSPIVTIERIDFHSRDKLDSQVLSALMEIFHIKPNFLLKSGRFDFFVIL